MRVREKRPFAEMHEVLALVAQAEAEVKPNGGRVLLRHSGTKSKARLLIEGRDDALLEKWTQKRCAAIEQQVGNN